VDAGAVIRIQYGQPMVVNSVIGSLRVAVAGIQVNGKITADASGQTFEFRPDSPWVAGATVDIGLDGTAYDATGVRSTEYFSYFTVAGASGRATSLTVSAQAIEVQLDGPMAEALAGKTYLHLAGKLIPARIETRGPAKIVVLPEAELAAGQEYRLVVGPHAEIMIRR